MILDLALTYLTGKWKMRDWQNKLQKSDLRLMILTNWPLANDHIYELGPPFTMAFYTFIKPILTI